MSGLEYFYMNFIEKLKYFTRNEILEISISNLIV